MTAVWKFLLGKIEASPIFHQFVTDKIMEALIANETEFENVPLDRVEKSSRLRYTLFGP